MSAPDDQPAAPRPSTGPPICDDRRADPAHPRRLEFEALVATTASREQTPRLIVEQRAIAALCHNLLSIAEVAARLHLPLGVTRLLVGDMADEDLVVIYRPAQPGDRPDRALLKRVLDGAATNRQPACGSPAAAQRHLGSGQWRTTHQWVAPGRAGIRRDLRDLEPYRGSRSSSPETAAWSATRSRVL